MGIFRILRVDSWWNTHGVLPCPDRGAVAGSAPGLAGSGLIKYISKKKTELCSISDRALMH